MRHLHRFFGLLILAGVTLLLAACGNPVDVQVSGSAEPASFHFGTGAGSATLSWLPPTQNTDGTPLIDLAGYRVYQGFNPDQLCLALSVANPGITTVVVDGLDSGTHYFAVTAYTVSGAESAHSIVRSKSVQ